MWILVDSHLPNDCAFKWTLSVANASVHPCEQCVCACWKVLNARALNVVALCVFKCDLWTQICTIWTGEWCVHSTALCACSEITKLKKRVRWSLRWPHTDLEASLTGYSLGLAVVQWLRGSVVLYCSMGITRDRPSLPNLENWVTHGLEYDGVPSCYMLSSPWVTQLANWVTHGPKPWKSALA